MKNTNMFEFAYDEMMRIIFEENTLSLKEIEQYFPAKTFREKLFKKLINDEKLTYLEQMTLIDVYRKINNRPKKPKLNIDRMDWEYIVQTINSSLLDDESKTQIRSLLNQGYQLSDMALDYLLIAIKHNNELVPSYKNHLIELVKEMNGGLDE